MTEEEPKWQEDDPERADFWGQFVVTCILSVIGFFVFGAEGGGFGVEHPGKLGYVLGGLLGPGGGWLVLKGIRSRSWVIAAWGLVLVVFACLALTGVAQCHQDCASE